MRAPPRETFHINRRQADTFFKAVDFADELGRPPNLFVTLNFAHTNCAPADVGAAFRRLLKDRFARWLRHHTSRSGRREPPVHRWNIEGRSGYPHVHWAVFVPPALLNGFRERLPKWLADGGGRDYLRDRRDQREAGLFLPRPGPLSDEGTNAPGGPSLSRAQLATRHHPWEAVWCQPEPWAY